MKIMFELFINLLVFFILMLLISRELRREV